MRFFVADLAAGGFIGGFVMADERVQLAVSKLAPREEQVLRLRLGTDGQEPQTFRAIGHVLGVGPQRVSQIEAKALRELRHPSRGLLRRSAEFNA